MPLGFAEAAQLTQDDAIAEARKLCAKQIPGGAPVKWTAFRQNGTWEVIAMVGERRKIRGIGVIIPVNGLVPKNCEPHAVRIAPQP
jgi:hypothetical protein